MSDDQDDRYWFGSKRYGWGWGLPRTWQGWLVIAVYFFAMMVGGFVILEDAPEDKLSIELVYFMIYAFALSAALTYTARKKGPPPRWRWGSKDDEG